jgi:hypothetical protein
MKGKLHKSMNYGWMVQDEVDSFYPLHPYDIFTNSIERLEGKEVDFILEDFWNIGLDEKLIKAAIISAKISDVPQFDEIQCNYCSKIVKKYMAIDTWMITEDNKNVCYGCQIKNNIGWGKLKQPKKD